ncbi:hypothetical protein BAUCODRAFT_237253 [Baudoinia panamericana UAMH 10762]|uniref:Uncharacterized protein n=1 Tax=Baudoinia panamericana (strain UAMH 10762) TaxID=717646 RepID=M2MA35_BAUPA|nr:uncharacterized protein BAUCODRAFT_237253 [Baudoinia panamericana UAMH 10762]EMC93336.1 hypothetical protein BAUCODRAFT_237253 [Baudoinia panamericana UAMH 10762]
MSLYNFSVSALDSLHQCIRLRNGTKETSVTHGACTPWHLRHASSGDRTQYLQLAHDVLNLRQTCTLFAKIGEDHVPNEELVYYNAASWTAYTTWSNTQSSLSKWNHCCSMETASDRTGTSDLGERKWHFRMRACSSSGDAGYENSGSPRYRRAYLRQTRKQVEEARGWKDLESVMSAYKAFAELVDEQKAMVREE